MNFTLAVMSRSAGKGDCSLILYSTTMVFLCQRTNPTCNAYYWCVFQVQNSASLIRTGVIWELWNEPDGFWMSTADNGMGNWSVVAPQYAGKPI